MKEALEKRNHAQQTLTDEVLVELLASGNEEALRAIFTRYYQPLARFAYTIVQRRDLAEEAVANVFQTLWTRRKLLSIQKTLKTYLFTAVKNQSIDLVRFCRREPVTSLDHVNHETLPAEHELPGAGVYQELDQEIQALLEAMPVQRRLVFRLNRFEGMRYREIARVMGISERTVQNHMVLAMKQIAPELPRLREILS
ncbi:MAG: RNA polymerase sigma-70 factor [Verrucomicrobiota bacterium JB022]|nr:RNA polymerase sigma-70 factor [Verrucomicrobiota bacterium JB022]